MRQGILGHGAMGDSDMKWRHRRCLMEILHERQYTSYSSHKKKNASRILWKFRRVYILSILMPLY